MPKRSSLDDLAISPIQLGNSKLEVTIRYYDHEVESFEKTRNALRVVWSQIPAEEREELDGYWRSSIESGREVMFDTFDRLVTDYDEYYAQAQECARIIKVNWDRMKHFPIEVYECVIAHEVGHAYQHSRGLNFLNITFDDIVHRFRGFHAIEPERENISGRGLCELFADTTMESWGFDRLQPTAWKIQFLNTRGSSWALHERPRTRKYSRSDASSSRYRVYFKEHIDGFFARARERVEKIDRT